jgi:hypothetical protein
LILNQSGLAGGVAAVEVIGTEAAVAAGASVAVGACVATETIGEACVGAVAGLQAVSITIETIRVKKIIDTRLNFISLFLSLRLWYRNFLRPTENTIINQ